MKQAERVAVVQRLYPRFNKQLDSCVTHGDETGIRLRADAAAAVDKAIGRVKPSEKYINISARVNRLFLNHEEFKTALSICGYVSTTAWINACIKRLLCESAARQKKSRGVKTPAAENYTFNLSQ